MFPPTEAKAPPAKPKQKSASRRATSGQDGEAMMTDQKEKTLKTEDDLGLGCAGPIGRTGRRNEHEYGFGNGGAAEESESKTERWKTQEMDPHQ